MFRIASTQLGRVMYKERDNCWRVWDVVRHGQRRSGRAVGTLSSYFESRWFETWTKTRYPTSGCTSTAEVRQAECWAVTAKEGNDRFLSLPFPIYFSQSPYYDLCCSKYVVKYRDQKKNLIMSYRTALTIQERQ